MINGGADVKIQDSYAGSTCCLDVSEEKGEKKKKKEERRESCQISRDTVDAVNIKTLNINLNLTNNYGGHCFRAGH